MSVRITGQGEDIIALTGDIEEEFHSAYDSEEEVIGFSDGTLLSVRLDNDGIWRVSRKRAGKFFYIHKLGDADWGGDDVVTLNDDDGVMQWAVMAKGFAYAS